MKKINDVLHKLEEENGTASKLGEKIIKILAIVLVAVVLLIILIIASGIGMFNWLTLEVRTLTGLDVFLAKGVAFILLAIFFGTPLSGFVWSLFPIPQKNKKRKRFIFLSILAVLFFAAYFTSKNVYFNPKDGKPMKYFSVGVNGEYNFSNTDGYDPVTGDKLKQVDKNTVVKYLKEKTPSENVKETKTVKEVESVNVNIDKQTLIGLEKDAHFYSVVFKNESERNFILCISATADVNKLIIVQKIDVGQSVKLSLMEGQHFFSYIDNNGYCYGKREGRTILTQVNQPINVVINKNPYYLERVFSLSVLASDNQVITMGENCVSHNQELSNDEQKLRKDAQDFYTPMILMSAIALVLLFVGWLFSLGK